MIKFSQKEHPVLESLCYVHKSVGMFVNLKVYLVSGNKITSKVKYTEREENVLKDSKKDRKSRRTNLRIKEGKKSNKKNKNLYDGSVQNVMWKTKTILMSFLHALKKQQKKYFPQKLFKSQVTFCALERKKGENCLFCTTNQKYALPCTFDQNGTRLLINS